MEFFANGRYNEGMVALIDFGTRHFGRLGHGRFFKYIVTKQDSGIELDA